MHIPSFLGEFYSNCIEKDDFVQGWITFFQSHDSDFHSMIQVFRWLLIFLEIFIIAGAISVLSKSYSAVTFCMCFLVIIEWFNKLFWFQKGRNSGRFAVTMFVETIY